MAQPVIHVWPVPPARETLAAIAEYTGAESFDAQAVKSTERVALIGITTAKELFGEEDPNPSPAHAARMEEELKKLLSRLEGVGAAVEPGSPGEAYFEADGLKGLWGGHLEGVPRVASPFSRSAGP